MAAVLPPGLDQTAFRTAMQELSEIVGIENISTDANYGCLEGPHKQTSYGDPYALVNEDVRKPSGAVRPATVIEVQTIVRLANKYKIPLWTVSRGRNYGYGGTSPVARGSLILDLHRMNKIIEVNEEYAYAIVQPGVTFFDLYNHIQEKQLNLWPSVPALGWGSVLGNTLDRGFGYTANGEHSQQQCGMEVVLPSGDLLRTGMGAMENNSTFPLYKGGFGPSLDGLFYQSNFGVVTQLGIHLTPAPEYYMSCEVSVSKEEDLTFLIGTLSDLIRRNIITNSPSIENIFRQVLVCQDPHVVELVRPYYGKDHHVPYAVLGEAQEIMKCGFWKSLFALYGPKEIVKASWDVIKRRFSMLPDAILIKKESGDPTGVFLTHLEVGEEEIPHSGIPSLAPIAGLDYRGKPGCHTCFSPVVPPSGRELWDWYLTAKRLNIEADFDFFADFHVYGRYIIAIDLITFQRDEGPRCDALYQRLMKDAAKRGYSEYRTHVEYMDPVSEHFNFNGGIHRKTMQTIKDTLDPNGVLSPGKSGIWNSAANSPNSGKT